MYNNSIINEEGMMVNRWPESKHHTAYHQSWPCIQFVIKKHAAPHYIIKYSSESETRRQPLIGAPTGSLHGPLCTRWWGWESATERVPSLRFASVVRASPTYELVSVRTFRTVHSERTIRSRYRYRAPQLFRIIYWIHKILFHEREIP